MFVDMILLLLVVIVIVIQLGMLAYIRRKTTILFQAISRTDGTHSSVYNQIQALIEITNLIELRDYLPPMRGWAISPDFGVQLISLIKQEKPKFILELGSGASTVLVGYTLQQLGHGKMMSFEQDSEYAQVTKFHLERHSLADIATVKYVPLKPTEIQGEQHIWYETDILDTLPTIDMLIVDAPSPVTGYSHVRYPALPLLFDKLSNGAVIVLDDANRQQEKDTVQRWTQLYHLEQLPASPTEKGIVVLRKR